MFMAKFKRYLFALLPNHLKRVYLCASVFGAMMSKLDVPATEDLMGVFNRRFKLATSTSPVVFGSLFWKSIWANLPPPPLTPESIDAFTETMLKDIPNELKYANDETIRREIKSILLYSCDDNICALRHGSGVGDKLRDTRHG